MADDFIRVCVKVPPSRENELKLLAKAWREKETGHAKAPGWDAKAIHKIAREEFGGLKEMFEHHGWTERGSDMMRHVQSRVKEHYGSIDVFVDRFESSNTKE